MLEDMLRAEGVPCMVRLLGPQPYTLTSGRREVLVPEFALSAARELLRIDEPPAEPPHVSTRAIGIAIAVGMLLVAACIALLAVFA
jgi:hypothetical protein